MEDSIEQPVVNGFLMVELGSSKDPMRMRSLNGRLTGAHKVLCSSAEVARVGKQDFYLGYDGGYMIPFYSKIGQGMRNHFEKLVSWYGKNELMPIYLENNVFNFYLNREIQPTENNNVNNNVTAENSSFQQSGNGDRRAVRS